jgi:hypothetical protein
MPRRGGPTALARGRAAEVPGSGGARGRRDTAPTRSTGLRGYRMCRAGLHSASPVGESLRKILSGNGFFPWPADCLNGQSPAFVAGVETEKDSVMKSLRLAIAVTVAGFALAGPAMAQTKTWNFGDATAPGSCSLNNGNYGNVASCTQQPAGTVTDLTVRAYSSDGNGSTYRTAALNYWGTGSGFGVYNQTEGYSASSPQHAMDNSTPGIDMMLLSFTSAEILKSITIGWSGTDGDFQVLAYTGSSSFSTTTIVNKTAAQLLTGGWSLVTTVNGAGGITTPDVSYAVNAGNVSSSYWLISAFNSAFGGSSIATAGTDSIKVLAISTQGPGNVPEPGTLALAGLGLFAIARMRHRRSA